MEIHNCIHCGTETQPGWRFCRRCGTGLEGLDDGTRVVQCGSCATPLADGWRFCFNCGAGTAAAVALGGRAAPTMTEPGPGVPAETESPASEIGAAAAEAEPPAADEPPPPFDEPAPPFDEPAAATYAEPTTPFDEPAPFNEETAPPLDEPAPLHEETAPPLDEPAPATYAEPTTPFDEPPPAPEAARPSVMEPGPTGEGLEIAAALTEASDAAPGGYEAESGWVEPKISAAAVSFEPASTATMPDSETATVAPPPDLDIVGEPPPPPPERVLIEPEPGDLSAPPAPTEGDFPSPALSDVDPPVIDMEPAAEGSRQFTVTRDITADDESAAAAVLETPAVVIPPRNAARPEVRTDMPRPLGRPEPPVREIPQPLQQDEPAPPLADIPQPIQQRETAPPWTPMPAAVPAAAPAPVEGELAPIDGATFRNPGMLGQVTQLVSLATAALAVTMIVSHILLNNRINDFATKDLSVTRIESVESIINSWQRPLLIVGVLASFVLMVVWGRRVAANISVFGKHVPESAIWMWLIPLVNIFVLRQHFDDAWKGSDVLLKDDPDWRKARGNWWSVGFTALSLLAAVALFYGGTADDSAFEAALDANSILMIGYFLIAAALLCAVQAISAILERQGSRAKRFV